MSEIYSPAEESVTTYADREGSRKLRLQKKQEELTGLEDQLKELQREIEIRREELRNLSNIPHGLEKSLDKAVSLKKTNPEEYQKFLDGMIDEIDNGGEYGIMPEDIRGQLRALGETEEGIRAKRGGREPDEDRHENLSFDVRFERAFNVFDELLNSRLTSTVEGNLEHINTQILLNNEFGIKKDSAARIMSGKSYILLRYDEGWDNPALQKLSERVRAEIARRQEIQDMSKGI